MELVPSRFVVAVSMRSFPREPDESSYGERVFSGLLDHETDSEEHQAHFRLFR